MVPIQIESFAKVRAKAALEEDSLTFWRRHFFTAFKSVLLLLLFTFFWLPSATTLHFSNKSPTANHLRIAGQQACSVGVPSQSKARLPVALCFSTFHEGRGRWNNFQTFQRTGRGNGGWIPRFLFSSEFLLGKIWEETWNPTANQIQLQQGSTTKPPEFKDFVEMLFLSFTFWIWWTFGVHKSVWRLCP